MKKDFLNFFICDFDINLNIFPNINLYIKTLNYNFILYKNDLFNKMVINYFFLRFFKYEKSIRKYFLKILNHF